MSDLYQIRKDIDSLMLKVNQLTSTDADGVSEIGLIDDNLSVLETNLTSFSNDLDEYVESLESFEEQLGEYGEDLTGFSGQLSNYGGQLNTFSGQLTGFGNTLTGFNTTLNGYKSRLDDFDDALNDESTGFITTLSTLKTYIYGYDPNNPSAHSYSNPTSDSLKGMTNTLQQLVRDLQTGDGIVLENLGRLKSHIQAFSGNLQQFKAYLAQQGVDISTLNDDVISLILELNKSLDTISEHQDMLEEAQEIIGEPSTQSTQATGIFKRLEDGEEIMDNVSTQADAIDVIVRGDPQVTGDTGLQGATSDLQTAVGDSSSGLIKDTNALKTTVGNSSSGLVKDTNALKTTVGNSSSGLVKKTNDLGNAVGDENTGLIAQTNELVDTIGEPASGGQSATGMHLAISNAQSTATSANNSATQIKGKIGFDQIGSTTLQQQIINQNGTISSQGGRISNVEGELSSQDSRITSAEGEISSQGSRVNNAEDKITDIQGDIGTVPSGKTLQGQITTIEDNAPVIITDFFLSDSITGAIQRVNKSLWNVGDNIWILFKLLKNNSTYEPTSTEFPITIFTPSGQSSTIYRYRRIPDGTVSGYLEVYKYTISESGLHLMVLNGKTYPINVDNFSKYTLSTFDTMDYDANFNTCDVTFSKQNHLVVCTYHISTTTYANKNDHTLTTSIPSAYRPSSVFYQDICTYGGQKLDGLLTVGTDGSMKIRMGTANTSMNVYGSFTYIV